MRIVITLLSLVATAVLLTGASHASEEASATPGGNVIACHGCVDSPDGTEHECNKNECTPTTDIQCMECNHPGERDSGGCGEHTMCYESLVDLGDLERAVVSEDVAVLRAMLVQESDISINTERGLLQVRNCQGAVVLQYPLTAHARIALAEE